jgi:hypothetical protein
MKISPAIVRTSKIEPSQPKEDFSETALNEATQLILDMAGVITPIILLRTQPEAESYRVIAGNFEYYAALQAMEIEPRKRNRINAYIIESEEEKAAYDKQIKVFRQRHSVPPPTQALPRSAPQTLDEPVAKPTEAVQDELGPSIQPQPPTLSAPPDSEPIAMTPTEAVQDDLKASVRPQPPDELEEPIAMRPTEVVQNDSKVGLEKTISTLVAKNDVLEKTMSTLVAKNEALEQTVNTLVETRDNKLHETLETLTRFMGNQLQDIGNQIRQQVGDQIKALGEALQIKSIQQATPTPLSPVTEPTTQEKPPISPEQQPPILVEPSKPSEVPVQPQQTVIIASTPEEQKFIEDINTLPVFELASKLEKIKAVKTVRENIIKERQKPSFQPFQSRDDLIERIKGLGKPRLKTMLERW